MSELKLSLEEIKELLQAFSAANVDEFNMKDEAFELSMGKNKPSSSICQAPPQIIISETDDAERISCKKESPVAKQEKGTIVKSPIVGTFYEAPAPDKPPFVTVGSRVKKGDILFVIESMKLMNEIQSDLDGEVIEILVDNGQGVEYGQPILIIS